MKSNRWIITTALVLLLLVVVVGQLADSRATAQAPGAGTILRYQISSYSGTTPGGVHHGCYIVDTTTG